eukprot:scaffold3571_cov176-Amphora_coffeaeformis.AAC.26
MNSRLGTPYQHHLALTVVSEAAQNSHKFDLRDFDHKRLDARIESIRRSSTIGVVSEELEQARQLELAELSRKPHSSQTSLRIVVEALKRTVQLRRNARREIDSTYSNTAISSSDDDDSKYKEVLTTILGMLGNIIKGRNMSDDHASDLANILVSFSMLVLDRPPLLDALRPLNQLLWQHLAKMDVTRGLCPNLCFDVLRASKVLKLDSNSDADSPCTTHLMLRLSKPDALGRLSTGRLVTALDLFDGFCDGTEAEERFLAGACRRVRKQKVRNDLNNKQLLNAVGSTNRFLRKQQRRIQDVQTRGLLIPSVVESSNELQIHDDVDARVSMWNSTRVNFEAQSLGYTLCHTFLYRANDSLSVAASDIATIMQCASGFISSDEVIVEKLCQYLETSLSSQPQSLSTANIVKVLQALEAWRCCSQRSLVRQMGMQFLSRVSEGAIEPSQANWILRSAVLLHGKDTETIQPFCEGAVYLLTNEKFLKQTNNALEVSNFLWFFNSARWLDHEAVLNVCQRLLDIHTVEDVSPRVARRTLHALTETMSWAQRDEKWSVELQTALYDMFDVSGEALLSARLTPAVVSSVMSSYAKATYTRDMGIFDHLVELMVQNIKEYSNRQVVGGLWACARMFSYEKALPDHSDTFPLYLLNIADLVAEIVERADYLTPKDTAQALYTLGLLEYKEQGIVSVLAQRAKELSSLFNGQELANVLWGISKAESKSFDVVFVLIRRLEDDDSLNLSPQEASNVLYALGRLDLRHEAVFTKLCNLILDQIESASAQSVANVLWASRAVYFRPPQKLLDTWAIKKLGLVAIEPSEQREGM